MNRIGKKAVFQEYKKGKSVLDKARTCARRRRRRRGRRRSGKEGKG